FGLICPAAALFGGSWMALFTADPVIRDVGELYLLCQALVFPLTGAGLACYFACLGIGHVGGPFLLALARLVLITGGSWLALALGGGPPAAFVAVWLAVAVFGVGAPATARAQVRG